MPVIISVFSLVLVVVLWLIVELWKRFKYAALYRLPGPKAYPLVGSALEFGRNCADFRANTDRILKEYGPIVHIEMGTKQSIFVSDAHMIHQILSSKNVQKSPEYLFLRDWLGLGLLTSLTDARWRNRRKLITPAFHFKILEEFVEIFNKQGKVLVEKLSEKIDKEPFDIHKYINLYTLDVIGETALGTSFNAQTNSQSAYVQSVKRLCSILIERAVSPIYNHSILFRLGPLGWEQRKHLKVVHSHADRIIRKRRAELQAASKMGQNRNATLDNETGIRQKFALLDLLLQSTVDGKPLDDQSVREQVDSFMFAGHDTTSSCISFTLYLLSKHPEIQQKVYEEQMLVLEHIDAEPNYNDLVNMKYLEMCIKESLRMYSAVPTFARITTGDVDVGDIVIPKDVNIYLDTFMLHRNPEIYPEPEKFDPERFSQDKLCGKDPFAFIPFGAGARNCIGQKFALVETKSVISKLIRAYEFFQDAQPHEPILSTEIVLRSTNGINVRIKNRKY